MQENNVERLVIVAPENVEVRLAGILAKAGLVPGGVFHTGADVLGALVPAGALVLTTYRLPDMTGNELARRLNGDCEVLMIAPQDYEQEELPENVLVLRNPISQDMLVQAIRTLDHCRARIESFRVKAERLARTLEERKVIDRAKGRLMDTLHLSESEAHYRIQKQSMDSGRRIVEIAREILENQEIAAS